MNKRVYGVLGISSIMANWNADFSGNPKNTSDGIVFGSDKAFKYPIKRMWENQGEKVIYIKSMKLEPGKNDSVNLIPKTLKERYEHVFPGGDLKGDIVLKNLFQAIDVKNFGATFAEAGTNISITGAVQIGQGFNKYEKSEIVEQSILSPFRDPKGNKDGEEAKNSTLGSKIVSDEAHYFYSFCINPLAYKEYVELGVTDGYTEEDYKKFKIASMTAATSFATNSKIGCENEFALYVETEENLYLPNLAEYISFQKGGKRDDKNVIQISCSELLNEVKDRILSVEIYYNPYTTKLVSEIEGAVYYNIHTQKEV